MKKKIILTTVNIISVITIAAAVLILLTVVLTKSDEAPDILGYSFFRVMTGSMEPTIRTDSLIVVHKTDTSEIREGDIISFYSPDPALSGAVNTHRVVLVEQEQGERYFVTRGDANEIDDRYPVSSENLIGKVVLISHPLGILVHLLSNPLIFIPVIVIPLFVMLLLNLIRTLRLAKKLAKEEEEAAIREMVERIREKKKEEEQR